MHFFEPIAGQAVKEAFMTLGYRKQTNSNEEAIHHLFLDEDVFVCLPTGSGKLLCNPTLSLSLSLVLTKSSSVLSTCVFSHQSKFTVYCTQNSK